jgi:malate dehydrogenase (oxaloacetate-decarboxylating)
MPTFRDFPDGSRTTSLRGRELLSNPALNKGTAFPLAERVALDLTGLLPPAVLTLEDQAARAYQQYSEIAGDVGKAVFLGGLLSRNQVLFYRVLLNNLSEMLPIVYTPTIGTMIQRFSREFRRPGGVYLSVDDPNGIAATLGNYGLGTDDVDLIVVTDGEGILGIGDWGAGGIAIAIGKLAVYTAAAGIDPNRVVPIVLDAGTNNPELLDDPFYLGNRHPRVDDERYHAFVDAFVQAATTMFPRALVHWEDLGANNATRILQRYRNSICTFNDDMQGTGAVALAAVLAGSQASGLPLRDQRIVVFGAGTAGIGIADQIRDAMKQDSLPANDGTQRIYCLGRGGLLVEGQPRMRDFQRPYAHPEAEVANWCHDAPGGGIDLLEVVRRIRPTVLIGTSGTPGAFNEDVIREMARHVERPVILPLSNPTSLAEAVPADLITWTGGRALIATGSPFPPVTLERTTYVTAQANNALVFPGLGLGAIVSGARLVTEGMLAASAHAVATLVDASQPGGPLLPEVNDLRAVSAVVAERVAAAAAQEGVARVERHDWATVVAAAMWNPEYRPLRASDESRGPA